MASSAAVVVSLVSTENLSVDALDGGNTLRGTSDGALELDYTSVSVGDLVLLRYQYDYTQNGLFNVTVVGDSETPFELQRWNDASASLVAGLLVWVSNGDEYSNTLWVCQDTLVEVGVSTIHFSGPIGYSP